MGTLELTLNAIEDFTMPWLAEKDVHEEQFEKMVREQIETYVQWASAEKIAPVVYSMKHLPNDIIITGPARFAHPDAWIDEETGGREFVSEIINTPRYGDAYRCFAKAVVVTGDDHHVFLEGLVYEGTDDAGINKFSFAAGS